LGAAGDCLRIFGAKESTLAALPIIATAATTLLVRRIGTELFDQRTGTVAAVLFSCYPSTLLYGNFFVPEPMVCCEMCAAVLLSL
jgi:4-amino-4-deoxy-L-arabinose transferase-like glycosyltransferase